jgi:hypothetical protein
MWTDRMNIVTFWTAPGAVLVIASLGSAAANTGPCYTADWDERITITGTVTNPDVSARCPRGVAQKYTYIETLDDEGRLQTWQVMLGPATVAPVDSLDLQEGEIVTVNGALLADDDENVLVALSVERGGETVDLRGPTGRPAWRGACAGATPGNPPPCVEMRGGPSTIELP